MVSYTEFFHTHNNTTFEANKETSQISLSQTIVSVADVSVSVFNNIGLWIVMAI